MKTWEEAVNNFYNLKRMYDLEIEKQVKKISKKVKSLEDKQKLFKKWKPHCVDCGRRVGTKFSILFNKEKDGRILLAVCGDSVDPCNLNIEIFCGYTKTYEEIIKDLEAEIKNLKLKIIEEKNKLLFGFSETNSSIEVFDKYKEEIAEKTERLTSLLELYFHEVDNKDVNETIKKLKEEIILTIGYIKEAISQFNGSNNLQFVNDSVEIYINQMKPKLKQIMNLENYQSFVEYEDGVFTLKKIKNNSEKLELVFQENSVISFNFKSSKKPEKLNVILDKPKIKEEIVVKIDDDDDEKFKFTLDEEGKIIWKSDEYERVWNDLSVKMRRALSQEPLWMEKSMDEYVKMKKEGKLLEFVEPEGLIYPPKELSDGEYNLGNDLYNKFYNNEENKEYKEMKEGELKKAMKQAISNMLDF